MELLTGCSKLTIRGNTYYSMSATVNINIGSIPDNVEELVIINSKVIFSDLFPRNLRKIHLQKCNVISEEDNGIMAESDLETMIVKDCWVSRLPSVFPKRLRNLDLQGSYFTEFPEGIKYCHNLKSYSKLPFSYAKSEQKQTVWLRRLEDQKELEENNEKLTRHMKILNNYYLIMTKDEMIKVKLEQKNLIDKTLQTFLDDLYEKHLSKINSFPARHRYRWKHGQ